MKRLFRLLGLFHGGLAAVLVTIIATVAAEMTTHVFSRNCETYLPQRWCGQEPVRLHLQLGSTQPLIGDGLEIHFGSNQDGYISLWDIGSSGQVGRIYPAPTDDQPNAAPSKALQVQQEGHAAGQLGFLVGGPPGEEVVYMIWTRTLPAQPQGRAYPSLRALEKEWQPDKGHGRDWLVAERRFWVMDGTSSRNNASHAPSLLTPLNKLVAY